MDLYTQYQYFWGKMLEGYAKILKKQVEFYDKLGKAMSGR